MIRICLTLLISALLCGCISNHNVVFRDTPSSTWGYHDDAVVIEFTNEDTSTLRDIDLLFMVDKRFNSKKTDLILEITAPSNDKLREVVTLYNQPIKSRGTSQSRELPLPYRTDSRLREVGTYKFSIKPIGGVVVNGVNSIGVNIKES